MSSGILVSLLWPKNFEILTALARRGIDTMCTLPTYLGRDQIDEISGMGVTLVDLMSQLGPEAREASLARAGDLTARAAELLGPAAEGQGRWAGWAQPGSVSKVMGEILAKKLRESMLLLDELEALRAAWPVSGVLLNETDTQIARNVALWARAHGIPSFLVSHGSNVGELCTVTREMNADYLLLFGERGMEPYLDAGVERERMVVTGNPAWDRYSRIVPQRAQHRTDIYAELGLRKDEPLVTFATTWAAKLTALQEPDIFEKSLAGFFAAARIQRERGSRFNVVVKGRPSNATERDRTAQLAQEAGFTDYVFATGPIDRILCASDAIVGFDSNVFVEAMIVGVPAVNVWTPTSWLLGPSFGAMDGIPVVRYTHAGDLADVIAMVLYDDGARNQIIQKMQSRRKYFYPFNDGNSAARCAQFIAERLARSPSANAFRHPWHELADPLEAAKLRSTSANPNRRRTELVDLIDVPPKIVLDIGCARGACGAEIKRRFPAAHVTGIEIVADDARCAADQLDRVITADVESLDLRELGVGHGAVDTLILANVLEYLNDPWHLLERLRPYLATGASIYASIPNIRNLTIIDELLKGNFPYANDGLLDVRVIRFFTMREIAKMFEETGYAIAGVVQVFDPRLEALAPQPGQVIEVELGRGRVKGLDENDVRELKTLEFMVKAHPNAAREEIAS